MMFCFQAEDGIRYLTVTGVQTCALPILPQPSPAPKATAGTLAPDEVRTIIAQAVSAAAALNRNVTVAVVDREVNVLGLRSEEGRGGKRVELGGLRTI